MENIINKFTFEIEELDQEVNGKKENGITTKWVRPTINATVSVVGTDLEHIIGEYSFCSQIITIDENGNREFKTVTEIYASDDDDNEDISNDLKTDLLYAVASDYRLYSDICIHDDKIANIFELAKEFGMQEPINPIMLEHQYSYLKSNHEFVSKLLKMDILSDKQLEQIQNL